MTRTAFALAITLTLCAPAALMLRGGEGSEARAADGAAIEAAVRHAEQELAAAKARG